jgi:uncharacterized RDD family membrane protein YckC
MVVEKIDTLQTVELAEGVEIRLRIAGPIVRGGAYLIDFMIRLLIMAVCGIILGFSGMALGGRVAYGLFMLAMFLLDWFYPVFFEAGKRGATPGKRMVGLKVVQDNGSPITFGQSVVRNFLRFIDGMPFLITYGVGLASCLASKRFQRLGDLAAGTVVVYTKNPAPPVIAAPPPMATVPLPVSLSADETRSLVLFRERAGLWSESRRAEIANHASPLSGAMGQAGVQRLMSMAHWVQEKREKGL